MLFKIPIWITILSFYINWSAIAHENMKSFKESSHDDKCFTQGLLFHKGSLYESCGLNGKSSIREVDLKSGTIVREKKLSQTYFAEGITIIDDKLFLLTWKNRKMFVFDINNFEQLYKFNFATHNGEGWGLTHDDKNQLIVSDGSNRLTFYKFDDAAVGSGSKMQRIKEVFVTDLLTKQAVTQINELEFVDGFVFANLWYKDVIVKIDPLSGVVVERYDMSALYPRSKRPFTADCLNGIAYDKTSKTFLLTGKLWDKYFHLKLDPEENVQNERILVEPVDL